MLTSGYACASPSSSANTSKMRCTAAIPASTQSCLAMIVAIAFCCGSMVAKVVASRVA
jgi:hypothetical protein